MSNLLNNVPKGITLINKKLVIVIAASLVSIIVIAVTLSFSGQKKTNPNTRVSTMGSTSESEDLSQLPSSYGDANKINPNKNFVKSYEVNHTYNPACLYHVDIQ